MLSGIINFIIGGFFVWLGFYAFILKTDSILGFFGPIAFFERYLGVDGGSRLGYKLLGVVVIVIGFLIAFGLFENFIIWMFSPITKYNNPPVI